MAIVDANSGIPDHSVGFRDATVTPKGRDALLNAAKMLALTVYDYLSLEELRKSVTADFNRTV